MRKLFVLIEKLCDEERYFKTSTLRVGENAVFVNRTYALNWVSFSSVEYPSESDGIIVEGDTQSSGIILLPFLRTPTYLREKVTSQVFRSSLPGRFTSNIFHLKTISFLFFATGVERIITKAKKP